MAIKLLPVVGRPTNPSPPPRKIAIEEHFSYPLLGSPNIGDSSSGAFMQEGFTREFGQAVTARMKDLRGSRIEEMDEAGIDISVISQTIGGVEGISDPSRAVETAQRINDFAANEVAESGGRLAGFATLPMQDVSAATKELDRAVNDLGLCAVMLNGYSNLGSEKLYLDDARFEPFWEELDDFHVALYLHPRVPSLAVEQSVFFGHEELTGATWGFAPETATHVLRMVYGGVFDRHPGVNLILGHMGETLPFFAWRIQRSFEYDPRSYRTEKRLQDYLSNNIWVTTSGNFFDQALITAVLTVGADHILFASDYPYEMATDAARWIERAPISERDRRKICYTNAAGLFRLPR
jgi:predicted TIM-barrel fold metal-dependent hydrolase